MKHDVKSVTRRTEPNEFGELRKQQTEAECECGKTFTGNDSLKQLRRHVREGHYVENIDISWPRDGSIRVDITFTHDGERCTAECWEDPNGEQHITIPELDANSEMDEIIIRRRASRILGAL